MPAHRQELDQSLYLQLRKQAQLALSHERPDHTLSATALVHEAYLRLGGSFANQAHFYASAGEAMRRVLIDHARARMAEKRGGSARANRAGMHLPDVAEMTSLTDPADILSLDEAFSKLEIHDAEVAMIVRLRFFAGLSVEETAVQLGISPSTVKREWLYARAFLFRAIGE